MNAMLLDPATGEILDPWAAGAISRPAFSARWTPGPSARTPARPAGGAVRGALRALRRPGHRRALRLDAARRAAGERVFGEIEKLLLEAGRPSIGLALLKEWGLLPAVAPELVPLAATRRTRAGTRRRRVDAHAAGRRRRRRPPDELGDDRPRRLALMLGALCHDLGKPSTTRLESGRIRSLGHEEAGLPPTRSLLDRWNVHTLLGYDVREQVSAWWPTT